MRIWKRLLGLALCLCAAVCVMSVSASAAEHNNHPVCGETHTDIGDHTGPCNAVEWIKVTKADVTTNNGLILAAGKSYYLGEDISVEYDITIKGTVNLCLNGHSITKTSESSDFVGVITVEPGSSFTLCDCNGSGASNGKLTHTEGVTGRGVLVGSSSFKTTFFLMYGGTISGNRINGQDGAGVRVHNASFKMYGGTITDNHVEKASNDGGGGVNARGKFIMYGGEISRNTSNGGGGGVAVVGASFEMHGGIISGNTATDSGGGVDLWNDSFTLSGGTISGNTAKGDGGGVYFKGDTLTISDTVKIEGNSAANGGGVYINSQDLSVTGGSIINNNATNCGGGVYFNGSSFNVSGKVNITGNMVDSSPNNVYLPNGKTIAVGGALTGSNKIGVTTENPPNASNYVRIASGNKDYADPDKFRYENDGAIAVSAVVSRNTATLVACKHNWSSAWTTDTSQHWKECSICKGKNDVSVSAHTYDQEVVEESYKASDATCTSPARYYKSCVCGAKGMETFESGEKNPDKHSDVLDGWQSNEDRHWKEYSCCHAEAESAEHSWGNGTVTKKATCTEPGVKTLTCSVCQREKTEDIAATGHDYGTPSYAWNGTSCTAKRVCANDAAHVETEAVEADVTVTQQQSCTLKELSIYTAEFKNTSFATQTKTNVETKPALGHDFTGGTWKNDADGHWKKCSRCDAEDKANKTAHGWGTPTITPATCTAAGNKHYICTECGAAKDEAIDALGHTEGAAVIENRIKPTCTAGGSYDEVVYCTVCNAELSRTAKTIAATGHSYGTPTYTWIGTRCTATRVCANDATHVDTETAEAVVTVTQEKTCVLDELSKYEASFTNTAFAKQTKTDEKTADATGHTWTPATCTTPKTCSVCSATEGDALGHSWGKWTVVTPATEDAEGTERRVCRNDGSHRQTRAIPKLTPADCSMGDDCPLCGFGDLDSGAWYHDGVHYCLEKGLMQGFSDGLFRPDGETTRAQLAMILWRLEGSPAVETAPEFDDVDPDAWYIGAVRWASAEGVVRGFGDGRFAPDEAVTREQMAAILCRCAARLGHDVSADGDLSGFADAASVSAYAVPALEWARATGLVEGIEQDGALRLAPGDPTTRAQMATLLLRFLTAA